MESAATLAPGARTVHRGVPVPSAAFIRLDLGRSGRPFGPNDLLVAATARAHDLVLVTHNTREFGRVPGLRVEDWEA